MVRHKVCTLGEVPDGEGRCFEVRGRPIAIFRVGGLVHALDNECPHRGGPLADGAVTEEQVICPWHGWAFRFRDGVSTVNVAVGVTRYEVAVEDDAVFVEL
jgi:nitrite reductase/ring-hydroxylating ferredoxin subunit